MTPSAAPLSPSDSIWTPFRHTAFRAMWSAGAAFFVGNAMLNMAASWLMIEMTGSSFLAALVQTSSFLPMFLLSLPGGVLADTIDRRRLMVAVQTVYGAGAFAMTVMAFTGTIGPASLLAFTFLLGACTALQSPAWNSALNDVVGREEMAKSINLTSMAFNGARAIGPALSGLILAGATAGVVFAMGIVSAVGMNFATRRYPPSPPMPGRLPPERLWGGTLSALRYVRHSPTITAQLVRTVAYSGIGSGLWALLPVVAQQHLGLGAPGYGLLVACLGTGAVCSGLFVARLRSRIGLDALTTWGCVLFGIATLVAALSTWRLPVYACLVFGGAAWMAILSTFNAATQTSAPPWIRARAAAMHTLCSLGSFALGAALWGAVAGMLGSRAALTVCAVCMFASIGLARRFPLRMGEHGDVTIAGETGELSFAQEPELESGPIAVEVIYRIRQEDAAQFIATLQQMAVPRKRDGATFWRIYRDIEDPSRYVERFIVTSWADYLRQRSRATVSAFELESRVRSFQVPGEPVAMRHYLAERAG